MNYTEPTPKLKIGLDIHGILDNNPVWRDMARMFVDNGHEVHVITGSLLSKAFNELDTLSMSRHTHYTHIFSITDNLIAKGKEVKYNDDKSPLFNNEDWDKEKALYCSENNITMHFDDTPRYAEHFTTPICIRK